MFREHLADHLWSIEATFKMKGVPIQTRMTIVRLSSRHLLIHSPIQLNEQIKGRLDFLGQVKYIVTPNLEHHLIMADYQMAFPQASLFAAPGLAEKRPDLSFAGVLGQVPNNGWALDLKQIVFEGAPKFSEVLFLDQKSRTLIVGDFCFNLVSPKQSIAVKALGTLLGIYGRTVAGPRIKMAIQDEEAARTSLKRILSWDFNRVLMAHGQPIETGGREKIAQAYAFLKI